MESTMEAAAVPQQLFGMDVAQLAMACGFAVVVLIGVLSWVFSRPAKAHTTTASKKVAAEDDGEFILDSNGQRTTLRRRNVNAAEKKEKKAEEESPKATAPMEVEPLFFKPEDDQDAAFDKALDELTQQAKKHLAGQEAAAAHAQKAADLAVAVASTDPATLSAEQRREQLNGLIDSLLLLSFGEEYRDVIAECTVEQFGQLLDAAKMCVEEMGVAQPEVVYAMLAKRMCLMKKCAFDQKEYSIEHRTKQLTTLVSELRSSKETWQQGGVSPHPIFEKFLEDALGEEEWARLKTSGSLRLSEEQFGAIRALAEKMLPQEEANAVYEGVSKWLLGEAMDRKDRLVLEQMKSEELKEKAEALSEMNRSYNEERDKFEAMVNERFGARAQAAAAN